MKFSNYLIAIITLYSMAQALPVELRQMTFEPHTPKSQVIRELEGKPIHPAGVLNWLKTNGNAEEDIIRTAALTGQDEVVKELSKRGKDSLNNAFYHASYFGKTDLAKSFLEKGADPKIGNDAGIRWAATHGNLDLVKSILKNPDVDPTAFNNYAIDFAAERGHLDIVNALLEDSRVQKSSLGDRGLLWATEKGHLEVVKALLKNPTVEVSERVIKAARGNKEIETALFQKKPDNEPKHVTEDTKAGHSETEIGTTLANPVVDKAEQNQVIAKVLLGALGAAGATAGVNALIWNNKNKNEKTE